MSTADSQATVFIPQVVDEAQDVLYAEVPEGQTPELAKRASDREGEPIHEGAYASSIALIAAFGRGFGLKKETRKALTIVRNFIVLAEIYTDLTGKTPVFSDYYLDKDDKDQFVQFESLVALSKEVNTLQA